MSDPAVQQVPSRAGIDAGLPYENLLPALREVNVNPLTRPMADIAF